MQVCLKGTLFTPLSKNNTSTQSLNVQLRKQLDLHVNIVHGFSLPGLPTRHEGIDIIVIRCELALWNNCIENFICIKPAAIHDIVQVAEVASDKLAAPEQSLPSSDRG